MNISKCGRTEKIRGRAISAEKEPTTDPMQGGKIRNTRRVDLGGEEREEVVNDRGRGPISTFLRG